MIEQRFVQTASGRVFYQRRRAKGPIIVMVAAAGFSGQVFNPMMDAPAYRRFDLIAVDLPGHGRSADAARPDETYHFDGLAEVLAELFDVEELADVTVLGWGLGGNVALASLACSSRTMAAIVVGAPALEATSLSALHSYHFTRSLLRNTRPRFDVARAVAHERTALGALADGRFVGDLMRTDGRFRPTVASAMFQGKFRDQEVLACSALKPVCMMTAADDPFVSAPSVKRVLDDPNYFGYGAILPSGGHVPFLSEPSLFDQQALPFLHMLAGWQPVVLAKHLRAA